MISDPVQFLLRLSQLLRVEQRSSLWKLSKYLIAFWVTIILYWHGHVTASLSKEQAFCFNFKSSLVIKKNKLKKKNAAFLLTMTVVTPYTWKIGLKNLHTHAGVHLPWLIRLLVSGRSYDG